MIFYVFFKNGNTKAPITGLAPSWSFLIKGADGTPFTPQPAITEVGNGYYKFSVTPAADLLGRIDGGAALATGDRYAEIALNPADTYLDAAISSRSIPGDAMILTAAYDAAKAAASSASVAAIPTNPVLATDPRLANLDAAISTRLAAAAYTAPDNVDIQAARADLENVSTGLGALATMISAIPTTPAPTVEEIRTDLDANSAKLALLDAAISSRLAAAGYTAPNNASITSILSILEDAAVGLARLDAELDGITASIPSLAKDADVQTLLIRESAPLVIPLAPAIPTVVNMTSSTTINLKRGDTCRVTFSLGMDCSGWSAYFGAKKSTSQESFDMALREATFSDEAAGTGYVDLSAEDTANVGTFTGEIEIRKDSSRLTPRTYTFKISDDVIK